MFKASMFKTRLNIAAITLGVGLLSIGNVATAQDKTVSADAKTPTALTKRASSTQSPKGFLLKTIEHDGQQYRYVLYVPEDYDATKPYPTIIFLNGAGECGRDGLKQAAVGIGPAIMLDVDKWRFLVLIPQKPEMVEAARAAGGDAKITTYPGVGHNSWDNAYREAGLADWFLLHTRKK